MYFFRICVFIWITIFCKYPLISKGVSFKRHLKTNQAKPKEKTKSVPSREQIMDAINRTFFPDVDKIRCVRSKCMNQSNVDCIKTLTRENMWSDISKYLRDT